MGSTNPWIDDDYSIGTRRNILRHACEAGFYKKNTASQQDREETTNTRAKEDGYASAQMLSLLTSMRDTQKEIDTVILKEVNSEIKLRLQDKETKDLTHHSKLGKKTEQFNKWNAHLQKVISNKSSLISHLQQPYVGDYIHIESSHKRYLTELIPQLVPLLSDLTNILDTFEWASRASIPKAEWEGIFSEITSVLASLHTSVQRVTARQAHIQQLHAKRTR